MNLTDEWARDGRLESRENWSKRQNFLFHLRKYIWFFTAHLLLLLSTRLGSFGNICTHNRNDKSRGSFLFLFLTWAGWGVCNKFSCLIYQTPQMSDNIMLFVTSFFLNVLDFSQRLSLWEQNIFSSFIRASIYLRLIKMFLGR